MLLEEIPSDICISIVSLLSPPDILSIRKTCRYFANITKERQVWLAVLNDAMHKHHIFKRSIQTASMDEAQLERLATTSFRFLSKLRKGCSTTELEHRHLKHEFSRVIDLLPGQQDLFWVSEVFLIPGGRFLLTRIRFDPGSDFRNIVILFDLQLPKCSGYTEVARWRYVDGEINAVNQSDDSEEIRVIIPKVVFAGTRDEQAELCVTRINLKQYETTGKSKIMASRTLLPITKENPGSLQYIRLIGDFVVCTYPTGNLIYVWNFVQDKFAKWEIPSDDYQEVFFDHSSAGTALVMVSWTSVVEYP
ncbi:hypothetical protein CVT24_005062 [Panaeolus cyanescens]|uniref:F-box domain-containing protein n=1 Tax=Panaeolus cyanescens TaxID=181874 RepID=A0A409WVM8_9AGAR|nr:hypothetical protein CVT24_005062 [Panaeolus cyanescens]